MEPPQTSFTQQRSPRRSPKALILLVHCTKGMECVVRVSSRWWGACLGPTLTTAGRETIR